MPDKGRWLHHMQHTSTVPYSTDGITYTGGAYTRLMTSSLAAFELPGNFFMMIYATPFGDSMIPLTQLIFSKKNDNGDYALGPVLFFLKKK